MFKFISNIIKFKKIEKRQFSQHVIFAALDAGEYFLFSDEQRWNNLPAKTGNFKVDFGVSEDHQILNINMHINDKDYTLNINTETESATYFANFLEALWCFKSWESLVYVSSTDDVSDFLCLQNVEPLTQRLAIMIDAKGKKEIVDICVDAELFSKEFILPLCECKPFNKIIEKAKNLEKYSPKKVKMPLP